MSIDELTPTEVGLTTGPDGDGGQVDISMLNTSTPLWFYILRAKLTFERMGNDSDRLAAALWLRYS